jgi:hypothetical protein
MEAISQLEYKGYTIKMFKALGKGTIKIYLGEDPIDYDDETDEEYEGSPHGKIGIEAAKQHIDLLEEKENSL